jgi:hypothetical protein
MLAVLIRVFRFLGMTGILGVLAMCRFAMSGLAVLRITVAVASRTVLFMKLLGAVRTIEIMAFAGNGKDGSGHE